MSKSLLRPLLDAGLYVIVFALIQILSTLLCGAALPPSRDGITATVWGTILSSAATAALFTWRRWSPPVSSYLRQRPWGALLWTAAAAIGAMVISDALTDALGADMPDSYVRVFAGIMDNKLGYIAIGILAPVAEEMVFRGGVLRCLLRVFEGRSHWLAIFFSALLFGVVHGNMAQGLNALLLGLLLGWLYCRTDSVVPGIVLHWVNNTIAFALYKLMPGMADMSLYDLCGGDFRKEAFCIVCALCVLLPSLYQLSFRLRR